jgi:hypothetical protein
MRNIQKTGKYRGSTPKNVSNHQPSSADQVAIVLDGEREISVVSPVFNPTNNTYLIDFAKLPSTLNITETLNFGRKNQNVPPVAAQTLFLTAIPDYSERSRVLALDGEILSLRDEELAGWLINAEQELFLGTDNHPVFETSLEETSCFVTRLDNGQVAMTEVPRQTVEQCQEKINSLVGFKTQNLIIETPVRAVARYFLTSQPEGEDILRTGKETEVTAFLLIGTGGFSYGLWSPATGLFNEVAFPAPPEIISLLKILKAGYQPNAAEAENAAKQNLAIYIRQAFEELFMQLSDEKLKQMLLSNYAQAVWAADPELTEISKLIAHEYTASTGLEFIQIKSALGESVAAGLLLGSFTFGADRVIGADVMPQINLARDLLVSADHAELDRQRVEEIIVRKQKTQAAFLLWAPVAIMLAGVLGLVVYLLLSQIMTGFREFRADARTAEFKDAVDRRKGYETNLKWYQEFIKQVSALRRQQPVGTNLLYELNTNYPLNIDPNFYVQEVKLNVNGGLEIKGLAKNKDAVTTFLRSLEFAGGNASGQKLFSNLTYEVQEGVDLSGSSTSGQSQLPQMAGSTLQGSGLAPGIIAWNIKGNYLPAVAFAPPDPKKVPPATQPPNANTAASPAPAAPNPANPANK